MTLFNEQPESDWETASPAEVGLDPAALSTAGAVLARPHSNARAFLVVRRGKIAWEQYFAGAGPADRHPLFSVTKSVTSALVGIALHEGYLSSLDQRVVDFFPEVSLPSSNPYHLLTLRHLLTMTTGLVWPRQGRGGEPMVQRLRLSPDWVRFILSVPVRREAIGAFHYCSAASHLLSAILTRATGQNACGYARERLFAPLGIAGVTSGADWEADPQDVSLGGWGLHLTAREIARFGWLYVSGGLWRGTPLVPAAWVQASTHPNGDHPAQYGYQWWLYNLDGEPAFTGLGVGGQYLFCAPAREMVIVILSQYVHAWPDRSPLLTDLVKNSKAINP